MQVQVAGNRFTFKFAMKTHCGEVARKSDEMNERCLMNLMSFKDSSGLGRAQQQVSLPPKVYIPHF